MSLFTMTTVASYENVKTKNEQESKKRFYSEYYQHEYEYVPTSSLSSQAFIAKDDDLLLESASAMQTLLQKSHSYSESIRPKATIIKQDSLATSLTAESDNNIICFQRTENAFIIQKDTNEHYLNKNSSSLNLNNNNNNNNNNKNNSKLNMPDSEIVLLNTNSNSLDDMATTSFFDDADEDACLLPNVNNSLPTSPSRLCTAAAAITNSWRTNARASACYRVHAFITRNWYLNYLVPLSILLALMFVAYLTRDYAKRLLLWIETQNPWIIFAVFILLFVIVSFPIVVGYFVLMITSGYLFGFFKGLLTVILGANIGIALAHISIQCIRHRIPMHRLIKNETGRAILRVISGPKAFKVVIFTRLTPIPFGLQNAIFGVSSINSRIYHAATFLGLLPAQTINVYLGSTLRSMHEVLNSHGTAVTGYISFVIEVICGVVLIFWVVQKARKELSETLLDCSTSESKIINIQV